MHRVKMFDGEVKEWDLCVCVLKYSLKKEPNKQKLSMHSRALQADVWPYCKHSLGLQETPIHPNNHSAAHTHFCLLMCAQRAWQRLWAILRHSEMQVSSLTLETEVVTVLYPIKKLQLICMWWLFKIIHVQGVITSVSRKRCVGGLRQCLTQKTCCSIRKM